MQRRQRLALTPSARNQTQRWRVLKVAVIVRAGLRCGTADACRWGDHPGWPRLQRLAERGVFHFDHIPVQSRLLVEIDVAEGRGNLRRNIVLPEMLDPLMSGP